jgi:hypothetical protein
LGRFSNLFSSPQKDNASLSNNNLNQANNFNQGNDLSVIENEDMNDQVFNRMNF